MSGGWRRATGGCRLRHTGLRSAVLALLGLLVGAGGVQRERAGSGAGRLSLRLASDDHQRSLRTRQPFGELFAPVGELPPQQFTGQARDGEAGLDYFGARFYQPRHGRFTQVDPVYAGLFDPQQWNRYAYARANPLSYVDPDGRATRPIFRSGVWEKMPSGDRPSGLWVGAFPGGEIGNIFEEGIGTDFWGDGTSTWVPPTIDPDPDPCPPGDCPEPPKPPKPPGPSTTTTTSTSGDGAGDDHDAPKDSASPARRFLRCTGQNWMLTNRVLFGWMAPSGLAGGLDAGRLFRNLVGVRAESPAGVLTQGTYPVQSVGRTIVLRTTAAAVGFLAVGVAYEAGVYVGSGVSAVVWGCP